MALVLTLLAACATSPGTIAPPPRGSPAGGQLQRPLHRPAEPDRRLSVADSEKRKGPLDRTFKALDADIVAFQEMESFAGGDNGDTNLARDWLAYQNTDYAVAAECEWREFPSTQPIFYRRHRL